MQGRRCRSAALSRATVLGAFDRTNRQHHDELPPSKPTRRFPSAVHMRTHCLFECCRGGYVRMTICSLRRRPGHVSVRRLGTHGEIRTRQRYANFTAEVTRHSPRYFDNPSRSTASHCARWARSEPATSSRLDAAAREGRWGRTSAAYAALILNRIADRMSRNLECRNRRSMGHASRSREDGLRPAARDRSLPLLRGAIRGMRRISERLTTRRLSLPQPLGVVASSSRGTSRC